MRIGPKKLHSSPVPSKTPQRGKGTGANAILAILAIRATMAILARYCRRWRCYCCLAYRCVVCVTCANVVDLVNCCYRVTITITNYSCCR